MMGFMINLLERAIFVACQHVAMARAVAKVASHIGDGF
jgi:hypothetical protein